MLSQPLPIGLMQKCAVIVKSTHDRIGYRALPRLVVSRANMLALGTIAEAHTIMGTATTAWKLRLVSWAFSVAVVVLAWRLSWWILLGLGFVVLADRYLAKVEQRSWIVLAATLLGLEMLCHDFAGWASAYPESAAQAKQTLPGSTWLDLYLPRRHELTGAALSALGPN